MSKLSLYALALLVFLTSCSSSSHMMTMQSYDNIQVGTPIDIVVQDNGNPSSVSSDYGTSEYKYVEKITNGNRLIYENHYILFVQDGKVTGKMAKQERRPAFDLIYQDDPNHNQYP